MASAPVQRHGPCPCGSTRRFVECCLPWEEAFRRVVARLAAFAATDAVRRLRPRAASVFWNTEGPEAVGRRKSAGSDACFAEWMLQDYVAPKRTGPLLGEFADTATEINPSEEQVLLAMLLSPLRAFEVTEAPGSRGAPVKDLLRGAEDILGPLGLPEGLIRSDVCVGRVVPVGRLRRTGVGLLRFPPGSQGELLAYLRASYGLSRPGRHVSLEDYVDGATHLYHHFFLERGRDLGARTHRTCRWVPLTPGHVTYRGTEAARIRAALARQTALELVENVEARIRYVLVDPTLGVAVGTVVWQPDHLQASAETEEDLTQLTDFLETCLRGLVQRVTTDVPPVAGQVSQALPRAESGPAGTTFIQRMLEGWSDAPSAALSGRTPREACESETGRDEVTRVLLGLERDMARQKRLGRAWRDVGPLWEQLHLVPPSAARGAGGENNLPTVGARARSRGVTR